MKIIVSVFCLIFTFMQCFAQNNESKKDTLFLLFNENGNSMTIENHPPLPIYTYHIGEDLYLHFSTDSNEEYMKWKIAYKKGLDYERQVHRDTITVEDLKKIKLKDIEWLKSIVPTFKWHERIYQYYDPIYIVEIDSISKQAIITRVNETEIIE